MSKPYRGLLIGCGYVSSFHLTAWSAIKGAEIVAVVDLDTGKAKQRAKAFGVRRYYGDYLEALAAEVGHDDGLDFVDIATPPATHLEMVQEAANRRLQILCQKPVAGTLTELHHMIRACDKAGVTLMINENQRFQPWYRMMKVLLSEGAIGRPYYANITSRWRGSLPVLQFHNQPFFATMPRLMIYELGTHHIDTLRYLLGEASSIFALTQQASPEIAGEDVATCLLQMNGVSAVIDMSWASIPPWDTENTVTWGEARIEGTTGTLYLRADGRLRVIQDKKEQVHSFPADSITLGFQATQQHFMDCLRSGTMPETSGPETLKTMELVFGAYASAQTGEVYRVGEDLEQLD
jgi:predicted dehydrogenase